MRHLNVRSYILVIYMPLNDKYPTFFKGNCPLKREWYLNNLVDWGIFNLYQQHSMHFFVSKVEKDMLSLVFVYLYTKETMIERKHEIKI